MNARAQLSNQISSLEPVLQQDLKPFEKYFKTKGLIELCINQPGEAWLETYEGWKFVKDPALSLKALSTMISNIATHKGQDFGRTVPMLSTQIPGYGYRLQALGPGITEHHIALSIRVGATRTFPIESYFGLYEKEQESEESRLIDQDLLMSNDALFLQHIMKVGRNVLVSGGTGTGKTSGLNSLLNYVPKDERIVAIEDTQELLIPQPNNVRLIKSKTSTGIAKITYEDLINCTMRLRPDRIFMGEIDIDNAFPFLKLINTGHDGCVSTIHANNPDMALEALNTNIKMAGYGGGDVDTVKDYIGKTIDVVVQIDRVNRSTRRMHIECLKSREQLL